MIQIERTYDPAKGLLQIEDLSGYVFSAEAFAHEFRITRADGDVWPGTITARLIRADGVTVYLDGTLEENWKVASVTLKKECYEAPGRFYLFIFNYWPDSGNVIGIYAGRGTALASETGAAAIPDDTAKSFEDQIEGIMQHAMADSNSLASLMAHYAVNISDVEAEMAAFLAQSNRIEQAMAENGIDILTGPNMLKPQDFYYSGTINDVEGEYVYGQTNRCYAYGKAYVRNARNQSASASGADPDEISEAVTTLNPTITDGDGSVYNKGIAFTVSTVPESGKMNSEDLIFLYGNHGEGEVPTNGSGDHDLDLVVGHWYTMSCWARVTSGERMGLEFGYGHDQNGNYYGDKTFFEVSGTAWRRVQWKFQFNPQGQQFYEYTVYKSADGRYSTTQDETYTTLVTRRSPRWSKTVAFSVTRQYAGTVELCGFRLVEGDNYTNSRINTLESSMSSLSASVLSSIAPVENNPTASTNYPAGALIVRNGTLYKTTTAVTTGATWAVGTNIQATTLAAELALKANA